MLETNDFFSALDDARWTDWKALMDTTIASVRDWSATVPFIICLAPTGGQWDKWGAMTVNKWEFDRRMREAASRILAAYDTPANVTNRVYVATFLGAIDPANISDHVHPDATGHGQMAPYLAGMLAKLITEGIS